MDVSRDRRSRDESVRSGRKRRREREEDEAVLSSRTTKGFYVPPYKLVSMNEEIEDKNSIEYQRLTWDSLRKSINNLFNKLNSTNVKTIIPELLTKNLIRGRGLFCSSCMKSQKACPGFTDVFAALVAVINSKYPDVGNLLLRRVILQLKRAFNCNDEIQLTAVKFLAHLVNQQVAHELVVLELVAVLLDQPTDHSIDVAVEFVKDCGSILHEFCPKGLHKIFARFREIIHEGEIDKRVQFLIEELFSVRKARFRGYPAVHPELDLVEPEDQVTHNISLVHEIDPEIGLDIFSQDPNFMDNEYEEVKSSILGKKSDDEDDGSGVIYDGNSESDEEVQQGQIKDDTETNLVNL